MQDHGPGKRLDEGQGKGEQGRVRHTYILHVGVLAYTVRMLIALYACRNYDFWKQIYLP